nr:hypothetical protein [Tanacetum cinerariifolium]
MTSFGYHLNPRYAIKECSSCGALYTRDCSCSKGSVEDKILVPKPPKNCARKFNRYSFFETPKVLLLAWDRVSEIKDAFENKQYKPEDVQELFCKLLDDLQDIHKELAKFINSPSWNRPAVYDDDDDDVDYTIAITPVLSTEEPDNSLSMRDEHLDTILATESDEVIKSSIEDLISIPCEFKDIPDTMLKKAQEKDKIRSKPDKNGKRVEAEKCQKQLQ